ncbi:iron-containing alcohol dehydrogenase [Oceanobacillus alkalisoli]|uniref:iron-containing alcohol dehydrogenase n=1 Tax=Oceanobacillus alkalisoli TaxID=2925113 RepID=UPI001EE3EAD1|nr:iron-containing alcohol dehydrogenase [Oceanobacillus alkalisoli]MCG5102364.1 iron-containing alcohol dehydrogenase [Oceanobacillus alkalisoli]
MQNKTYHTFLTPTTIQYGRGAFQAAGEITKQKGKKALIVSDKIMDDLGYVSELRTIFQKENIESALYLDVASEPVDRYVTESLDIFIAENCNVIISLGGGSCIDTAKAVAVVATNGGYIGDYKGGGKIAGRDPIPHIAIPTTAGTGSEATDVTVITNTTSQVKMMIKQPAFLPEVAIIDPLLTISSPKSVTAATGVDALSHAIEAYISKRSHPMTDTLAISAMKLIVENLKKCYENGDDLDAREAMSLGALQAGLAFSNASVCLVHGMSRPIGALFNVPHGVSNAMLLPTVLEFTKDAAISRLADLGRIFDKSAKDLSDQEASEIAVTSVKQLCSELNIPNLKGWGIDKTEFDKVLSKMADDALASGSPQNTPIVPAKEEIEKLYLKCFDYQLETEDMFN